MGLAAVGTFLWINQPAPALPESAPINPVIATFATFTAAAALTATPQSWTRLLPLLDFLWFAGVCVLAVRAAMKLARRHALRRTGVTVASSEWQDRAAQLMRRLAIAKPVRLCES